MRAFSAEKAIVHDMDFVSQFRKQSGNSKNAPAAPWVASGTDYAHGVTACST